MLFACVFGGCREGYISRYLQWGVDQERRGKGGMNVKIQPDYGPPWRGALRSGTPRAAGRGEAVKERQTAGNGGTQSHRG